MKTETLKRLSGNSKGFSLIELMIVVAIIGILSAIAIPNYQQFQAKSRQSEARTLLTGLYTSEKAFMAEYTQYFADFRNIGFAPEGTLNYNVGWTAAGAVNAPANYTGPGAAAGAAATQFNATLYCAGGQCRAPAAALVAQPASGNCGVTAAPAAAGTFVASASGNIDADAVIDGWSINERKDLCNATVDL